MPDTFPANETTPLTEEEHKARAMLLGMSYHHGNGEPFYYIPDPDGSPNPASITDADTLEPVVQHRRDPYRIDWQGMLRRNKMKKVLRDDPFD